MNNSQPLISLLVANFNNGEFIEETLQSAVDQTYTNIEIVVIDDASMDSSVEKVKAFVEKNPAANIHFFVNEKNSGGCGSIKNQCIAFSKGEYFAFLDPEDTIEPNAVEELLKVHLENQSFSIVYCTHWLCNEKLEPQSISTWVGKIPDGQSHLTSTDGHISAFALCKRADYDKTDGINPTYQVAEDQDLYLKMEEIAPVYYIDKPLYYYRKHDHNSSWNEQKQHHNLFWYHLAQNAARKRRKQHQTAAVNFTKKQIDKKNFGYHIQMAKFYRRKGNFLLSLKEYFKALPYCYTFILSR
ncbi:MAG: glycosyltransferase family 2 protein [Prevotellaceae bacterium]|jgi:glycosyltransferase involved in cell wall biosynthesis|nr:glycosyltransferase family 2 protein [Prevotellaceae bacterium]